MADQADVESSIVVLATTALYPNGSRAASVTGGACRVYRGWPQAVALDSDLRAGTVNVTIFASHGSGRLTTRYGDDWVADPVNPSLSVEVIGSTVAFAGSAEVGQIAGVRADGQSYVYRIQPTDDTDAVAANLAVLIGNDRVIQRSGASLTIPGAGNLVARVVADARASKEVRRQSQLFRISCWCPSPSLRDAVAIAIDQSLSGLSFIDLPDGSQGRIIYSGTTVLDQTRDAPVYRRDLLYNVEYPTILSILQPAMLFGDLELGPAQFIA